MIFVILLTIFLIFYCYRAMEINSEHDAVMYLFLFLPPITIGFFGVITLISRSSSSFLEISLCIYGTILSMIYYIINSPRIDIKERILHFAKYKKIVFAASVLVAGIVSLGIGLYDNYINLRRYAPVIEVALVLIILSTAYLIKANPLKNKNSYLVYLDDLTVLLQDIKSEEQSRERENNDFSENVFRKLKCDSCGVALTNYKLSLYNNYIEVKCAYCGKENFIK